MDQKFSLFPVEDWILQIFGLDFRNKAKFVFDQYPLSSTESVIIGVFAYLGGIFLLQKLVSGSEARKLKAITIIHNALLSFFSAVLLIFIGERLFPRVLKHGLFWGICSEEVFDDHLLNFFYYCNYILKYVELLDTILLVLAKKPLQFLHVYHHTMTMILCWTQLHGETTVVLF